MRILILTLVMSFLSHGVFGADGGVRGAGMAENLTSKELLLKLRDQVCNPAIEKQRDLLQKLQNLKDEVVFLRAEKAEMGEGWQTYYDNKWEQAGRPMEDHYNRRGDIENSYRPKEFEPERLLKEKSSRLQHFEQTLLSGREEGFIMFSITYNEAMQYQSLLNNLAEEGVFSESASSVHMGAAEGDGRLYWV